MRFAHDYLDNQEVKSEKHFLPPTSSLSGAREKYFLPPTSYFLLMEYE